MPRAVTLEASFDSHHNSIGFLRWLMAFLVIFSHAGPIGGFYGGEDLGVQISHEQSLGGVAVAGFFFFSGFLITRSRFGRSSTLRYFWKRVLRIFPAYWVALLLTVGVMGPIAWRVERGTWSGYWGAEKESPLTYFVNNMFLRLGQRNIAGEGANLPYAQQFGNYDWNGSAWTLLYEFKAYILVGLLGLFGVLTYRWISATIALGIIVLNAMQWMGAGNVALVTSRFADPYLLMLFAPFAFGMVFALLPQLIPIDDRLMWLGLCVGLATYAIGGWNIFGQYGFLYVLMWVAVRAPLTNWEQYGDLSYGIYIFAWPVMTLAAQFGLHKQGWVVYHLVIVVIVHILAFASWHLIEKPALSLKNWTPGILDRFLQWFDPIHRQLTTPFVNPRFASGTVALRYQVSVADEKPSLRREGDGAIHTAPHDWSRDGGA